MNYELTKDDVEVLTAVFKGCSYLNGRVGGDCASCGIEQGCFRVRKKLGTGDLTEH